MNNPTTWNQAASRILSLLDDTTPPLPYDQQQLENTLQRMTRISHLNDMWVDPRAAQSDLTLAFHSIARMMVGHLKLNQQWDSQTMLDLLVGKQHDYGHGNILAFKEIGLIVRLSDKVARLKNLQHSSNPRFESLLDTYRDILGYCVIAEMLADHTFTLELESTNA